MKKITLLTMLFALLSVTAFAQKGMDRRTFKGTIQRQGYKLEMKGTPRRSLSDRPMMRAANAAQMLSSNKAIAKRMEQTSILKMNSKLKAKEGSLNSRPSAKAPKRIAKADGLIVPPTTANVETWYTTAGKFYAGTSTGWADATSYVSTVNVAIDGNDIYIQGLAYWFEDGWIKGTISGDKAIFESGQLVGEDEYGPEYIVGSDDAETVSENIVFNYDAEQGILEAVTAFILENSVIDEISAYCYWTSPTFSKEEPIKPELVTPPATATVETWYTAAGSFYAYTASGYVDFTSSVPTVNVAIDGNDIYIQGLAYWFEDSWIKGTISGDKAIFENGQFVGEDEYGPEYIVGSDDRDTASEYIVFNYDAEQGILQAVTSYIFENSEIDEIAPYCYWDLPTFTKEAPTTPDSPLVTPPSTATVETWYTIDGNFYAAGSSGFVNYTSYMSTVNVAIDGNDIYVQGLAYWFDGWIKGTISGDKAIFESGQLIGEDEYGPEYIVGSDDAETVSENIVFNYDAEQGILQAVTTYIIENSEIDEISPYCYWLQPTFSKEPPVAPELVVVPEDLVTEEYFYTYTDYLGETINASVNVGFDGNDVYIQGICDYYLPEAWIKGTLDGTTITFPGGQYLGSFLGYDLFLQEGDIVFNYDADANMLVATDTYSVYTDDGYEADSYERAVIYKVIEKAIAPATPEITGVTNSYYGPIVDFSIPITDVEGNGLVTSKLSYQFFSDENHVINPVTFDPEYYIELTDAMTVIPYHFTDDYDIYYEYIYFNMPEFSNWNKIGIQSIYTGGGEENKSEIFWYTLKEYEYKMGDVNHDGEVSVADVLLMSDYVLQLNPEGFFIEQADLDGDGEISLNDVMSVVDLVLQIE